MSRMTTPPWVAAAAAMTITKAGLIAVGEAVDTALHAQTPPVSQPAQPQPPATQQPAAPLPPPSAVVERITFADAVARALQRNPSVEEAAADILRADALLRQARANIFPQASGTMNTAVSTPILTFNGADLTPRTQLTATAPVSQWLFAPVQWALRTQAADNKVVAQRTLDEAKRQIALSAAEAFLTIIAERRLVEVSQVAVDTAKAHYDYAHQLQEKGAGSRLNELRAQRDFSTDQATLENARIGVYRAQEALGVLLAADAPIDVADEPALALPITPDTAPARVGERPDVKLAIAREQAARRVVTDSWKEYLPTVKGSFTPQYLNPSTLFSPTWSTRTVIGVDVNIFDSGLRAARKAERAADFSRVQFEGIQTRRQAASEIRTADEAVRIAERAVSATRAAADQARQVVDITNVAFRAGATTNIEVIDAQREARDADNAAASAEDTLRRARLDLLVSTGRFP
jgi:outer membrane protein